MVACDIDGKPRKFDGAAEHIIRWLADGGYQLFAVRNMQGAITFNFHNGNEKTAPKVTPIFSGVASPPGTAI